MNPPNPSCAPAWRLLGAAILAGVLCPAPGRAQDTATPAAVRAPLPADRAAGAATITEAALREWLGTLASPDFAGRGTGQPGYGKAAAYVRDHFRALGLEPGNGDEYFQRVPWQQDRADPRTSRLALTTPNGDEVVIPCDDLRGELGAGFAVEGPALFVVTDRRGEGLAGLDLTIGGQPAAVLLLARGAEQDEDEPNSRRAPSGALRIRRSAAQLRAAVEARGGKLAALVDDAGATHAGALQSRNYPAPTSGERVSRGMRIQPSFLVVTAAEAERFAAAAGVVDAWRAILDTPTDTASVATAGATLRAVIEVESSTDRDAVPAENVLAILPGSDPALRDEYVAVGCHLDHLGVVGGTIHPGADDDGSGSAGLMAIAKAFAENPNRPKRSVLFLAFCGEERGLIGSAFYARNPTLPLDKMIAELQVDMIGRNEIGNGETAEDNLDCLHLVGSQKLSRDLHELCIRLNTERAGFALEWDEEDVFYRSDHWNFARVGVPIAFFFTGFHPEYHRPTDTADKIDYRKLQRVATYVYDLAYELADAPTRPLVDADLWETLQRKGAAEPVAPVRGR